MCFSRLNARANRVAHALMGCGLMKGDRVAAYLDNCLEYPEIIYGCSKAGIVLVPINYRLTPREAEALLRHSGARMVFISERINASLGESAETVDALLSEGRVVVGLNGGYEQWLDGRDEQNPNVEISESDTFYIGYTSGTTGHPKGALIPHRARGLILLANAVEYGLVEDDINLTPGAIYHASPFLMMLLAINIGGTTVIMPQFDPEEMLRLIETQRATNAFVAPTMLHMIQQLPEETKKRYDLDSMRVLVSAGAPLSAHGKRATRELFGEQVLHEYYGSTEAGWNLNLRPKDQLARPHSCGKPTLGWEVALFDDAGQPVTTTDTVGEIHVRGEYLFDGYVDDPEATAEAFNGNWFSAGDLATFDAEGFYTIVGRKKDMILSGGANVYPEEIEECLHDCPGVADIAVIGVADDKWGECVTAIVALVPGATTSEEDIRAFCAERIAGYKKPRTVHFVDEVPRNPSGKIQKTVLRKRFAQDQV